MINALILFYLFLSPYTVFPSSETENLEVPGGSIVFRTNRDGGDELYIMGTDGSTPHRLTFNGIRDTSPQISPDGRYLMYYAWGASTDETCANTLKNPKHKGIFAPGICDATSEDILVIDLVTGETETLTKDSSINGQALWSPDGEWITFVTDMGQESEIVLISPDSSKKIFVTRNYWGDYSPSFTPDGKYMIYESYRLEQDVYPPIGHYFPKHNLYEEDTVLETWSQEAYRDLFIVDLSCILSIDSSEIKEWENLEPYDQKNTLSPEALCEERVTDEVDSNIKPQVSPDGKWIAYMANRPGVRNYLYLMSVALNEEGERDIVTVMLDVERDFWEDMTDKDVFYAEEPYMWLGANRYTWSPDSTQILIEANLYSVPSLFLESSKGKTRLAGKMEGGLLVSILAEALVVYDLETGATAPVRLSNSVGVDHSGDWSPDGKWVVYSAQDRYLRHEIYLTHLKTGYTKKLTTNRVGDFDPIWVTGSLTKCGFEIAGMPKGKVSSDVFETIETIRPCPLD